MWLPPVLEIGLPVPKHLQTSHRTQPVDKSDGPEKFRGMQEKLGGLFPCFGVKH